MNRILILILLITSTFEVFAQSNAAAIIHMPAITQVHAKLLGIRKTITGTTRSVPPRSFYKIDGYDYLINLELSASDPSMKIDTTINIVCIFPDKSVKIFRIRPDSIFEISTLYYQYSFSIEIQMKGLYSFILATNYEIERPVDPIFYQQVSNNQSIYLHTPAP
jgi:hypothetical protein